MSPSQLLQPGKSFKFFPCLPMEIQIMIFEEALEEPLPRIVKLDTMMAPTFDTTRFRQVVNGWQLKVENPEDLQEQNQHEVARTLRKTCDAGKYVADRFIKTHPVWDPPRHSQQLLNHDLSLSADIFWLPDDLFTFDWNSRTLPRAGKEDCKDEERIGCLMVSIDALEEVLRWANGQFNDQDLQDSEDHYVSLDELSLTLHRVLAHFPSCGEIVVVSGTPSGDRKHISWSDLNYIAPGDKHLAAKCDQFATDCDEADRCLDLLQSYYDLDDDDSTRLDGPLLSFAFKKDCKPCSPLTPAPDALASGKRSRDDGDDDNGLPSCKRQKI